MTILIKLKQNENRIYNIIDISDRAKKELNNTLDQVQKRSQVRTIDANKIYKAIIELEKKLTWYGIKKADLAGFKCDIDLNAQSFPSAYKYKPMSTAFHVVCKKAHQWIVSDIQRFTCQKEKVFSVVFTEDQEQQLLDYVKGLATNI